MTQSKWKNFTVEELTCNCGCGLMLMDEKFMYKLVEMRTRAQFPFPVNSGYRCPEYNMAVSHTGPDGPHTTGKAVDILISNSRLYEFWKLAYHFGFTGHGHGEHKGFVHIDDLTEADGERFRIRPNAWWY